MKIQQMLRSAIENPGSWDIPGLLEDAATEIDNLISECKCGRIKLLEKVTPVAVECHRVMDTRQIRSDQMVECLVNGEWRLACDLEWIDSHTQPKKWVVGRKVRLPTT